MHCAQGRKPISKLGRQNLRNTRSFKKFDPNSPLLVVANLHILQYTETEQNIEEYFLYNAGKKRNSEATS